MAFQNTSEAMVSDEQKLERMRAELSRVGAKLEEATQQAADIKDRTADLRKLETEVATKEKRVTDLTGQEKVLKKEVSNLMSQLGAAQTQSEKFTADVNAQTAQLVAEKQVLEATVSSREGQLKKLEYDIVVLARKQADMERSIETREKEFGQKVEQFDIDSENFLKKKFEYNQTLKEIQDDSAKITAQLERQKSQQRILGQALLLLHKETDTIAQENTTKKQRFESFLEVEVERLKQKKIELDAREASISDKEAFLGRKVEYLKSVKSNIEDQLGHKLDFNIQ